MVNEENDAAPENADFLLRDEFEVSPSPSSSD
jgi:hypothetical protein